MAVPFFFYNGQLQNRKILVMFTRHSPYLLVIHFYEYYHVVTHMLLRTLLKTCF